MYHEVETVALSMGRDKILFKISGNSDSVEAMGKDIELVRSDFPKVIYLTDDLVLARSVQTAIRIGEYHSRVRRRQQPE